jgi:flavin-dependent dehydrogenase
VGIVAPARRMLRTRDPREQIYERAVGQCPAVGDRLSGATRVTGYFVTKDYSYRATANAGDGWVMIGDAYAFLDPLYSSGVLLALRSGEMTADAIVEGLAAGDTSAAQLGRWQAVFDRGVDRMRRLVSEYYDGFSFGNFVRHYPELRGTVTDLLIGDLFTDRVDKVWGPMESLYPPGKPSIPAWNASPRPEDVDDQPRVRELSLPEGHKP